MRLFGFLAALTGISVALDCHPEGPLLPRPRQLAQSILFQEAMSDLSQSLDNAFVGKIKAGFDTGNLSVSIGVVSFDQLDAGVPVWEYHRLSPANVNGTKSIDRDSQYLIGSISKAVTACTPKQWYLSSFEWF